MLISYLDEEMLVVRDSFGRPDVLMRVDAPAAAPINWFAADDDDAEVATAPSDLADDVALSD